MIKSCRAHSLRGTIFFRSYKCMFHCVGCTSGAGCKPNCCTQPRAAPWGKDVALIKVSRSEMSCKREQSSLLGLPSAADIMKRATCFMRGNAPCGVKGFNGLRAFGAWHFCVCAKMPNVSIAVYVPPGRCPGLRATIGLTARPNHLTSVLHNVEFSYKRAQFSCNSWANKTNVCARRVQRLPRSLARRLTSKKQAS